MFIRKILLCLTLATSLPLQATECVKDPARVAEVAAFDDAEIVHMQGRYGIVAVPSRVHDVMHRLVAASRVAGRTIELSGFRNALVTASAADHGRVLISSAALADELPELELAAVLAHELAHVEASHTLEMACKALELVGSPDLSLADAMQTVGQEAFDSTSELSKTVSSQAQARELAADARGMELLLRAGYDPQGMTRLIARISRSDVGFSSGTHPKFSDRQAHALEYLTLMQVSRPQASLQAPLTR